MSSNQRGQDAELAALADIYQKVHNMDMHVSNHQTVKISSPVQAVVRAGAYPPARTATLSSLLFLLSFCIDCITLRFICTCKTERLSMAMSMLVMAFGRIRRSWPFRLRFSVSGIL